MYWVFLLAFIIAVLIPDIIRGNIFFLSETRAEEIAIFLMGAIAFFAFIKNEQRLIFQEKEKEKDQKKINQTVNDLVESYTYIGEVNRKMDLLMNIALGLTDRSVLNKSKENDIYRSIVIAAKFLFKADFAILRFVDIKTAQTKKEIGEIDAEIKKEKELIKNKKLISIIKKETTFKKYNGYLIVSSLQEVNNIKSFIIVREYDDKEENNPKNSEIFKVFASQALFVYSFTHNRDTFKK